MLVLAVDTSTQAGSVAVLRDNRVLGVVSTWVEETYSSRMFRHLDFLLAELSLELSQFELFAVAAGPGSFTGLRVGLAAVKAWSEVYKKPIAPVSGLEAVAAQARSTEPLLVPVMDARRGQIYAGVYRRGVPAGHGVQELELVGKDCVLTPEEFLAALAAEHPRAAFAFVTSAPEVLAAPLAASPLRGMPVEHVSSVLGPIIGRLGLERAQRGELVDALHLDANYIRSPDAEVPRKVR